MNKDTVVSLSQSFQGLLHLKEYYGTWHFFWYTKNFFWVLWFSLLLLERTLSEYNMGLEDYHVNILFIHQWFIFYCLEQYYNLSMIGLETTGRVMLNLTESHNIWSLHCCWLWSVRLFQEIIQCYDSWLASGAFLSLALLYEFLREICSPKRNYYQCGHWTVL